MREELRQVFGLACITKWDVKPVDTDAIRALGERFYKIAMDQEGASLNVDTEVISRRSFHNTRWAMSAFRAERTCSKFTTSARGHQRTIG